MPPKVAYFQASRKRKSPTITVYRLCREMFAFLKVYLNMKRSFHVLKENRLSSMSLDIKHFAGLQFYVSTTLFLFLSPMIKMYQI